MKTAVEWLIKTYLQNGRLDSFDIEQAKEMNKQQMWKSFVAGQDSMEEGGKDYLQYYNENYGE